VRGNVAEVGPSILVQLHTVTIVSHLQHDLVVCSTANDIDVSRPSINRILDQLADGLQGMRL